MPANLTPQYIEAEEAFKRAATTEEKILALEEMLRTIPKHKGTEKMQADIKRRLSRLREEGEAARRKGKGDPFRVEREGAGQVFTVGLPNSGKSALVGALTKAKVLVAPYPFSTQLPIPGMMPYEDVLIQLVDSPPISPDLAPPALLASIRLGDGLLISLDVSVDSCLEDLDALIGILEDRRVLPDKTSRTLLALTKVDLDHARENAEVVRATFPQFSSVEVSTKTGEGLDLIPPAVFRMLDLVRVYSKPPGCDVDRTAPFVLRSGGTVEDLAAAIHRDLPSRMKSARVWGSAKFEGQSVPRDHVLRDGDVVEFHS